MALYWVCGRDGATEVKEKAAGITSTCMRDRGILPALRFDAGRDERGETRPDYLFLVLEQARGDTRIVKSENWLSHQAQQVEC